MEKQTNLDLKVKLDIPYPKVQIMEKNSKYAREMLDNFGGRNSEMTAISSYLHANLVLLEQYPQVADIFMEVDEVEMEHLHIFGELAALMGMEPRMWSFSGNKPRYWSPRYGSFPHQLLNVLNGAIKAEQAAVDKYKKQAENIKDRYIVDLLERIIMDEEQHIEIFNYIKKQYFSNRV